MGLNDQSNVLHPPLTDNHLDNVEMLLDETMFSLMHQRSALQVELQRLEDRLQVLQVAKDQLKEYRTPKRLNMQQMVEESVMAGVQRARPGAEVDDKLEKATQYAVELAEKTGFPHKDPEFWKPHLMDKLGELMGRAPVSDPGPRFPPGGVKPRPED
jgi:hypothetical protein